MTTPFQQAAHAIGMPSGRKTRRGGRGKGPAIPGTPSTHLSNLSAALSAGNHGQARSHAFALIRSLPRGAASGGAAMAPTPADMVPDGDEESPTPATPKAVAAPAKPANRLAGFLTKKKQGGVPV